MKKDRKELIIYLSINIVLLIIILCLVGVFIKSRRTGQDINLKDTADSVQNGKLFDATDIVKEEVTVNTQVIEDGLRRMGQLICEEYYFTQVEEYSSSKKILFFDSKAAFTYSYDGVVSAGIECDDIIVNKDDEKKLITIRLPKSKIIGVGIDFDSFKIYEEKQGLWNKLDMSSYNNSLKEFENAAKEKALQKGILEKADESCEKIIKSFVDSVLEGEEYKVEYVR